MADGRTLLLLTVGTMVIYSPGAADWRTDPEWSFQTQMGADISLVCNDSLVMLEANDVVNWHLPKGGVIQGTSGRNDNKYELMDGNNVVGMILKVKKIAASDKGLYLCMVYRNTLFHHKVNRGVNMYGHLYQDPFDKYRTHLLVAGVAAAVFLVPALVLCFLYKFRYKSKGKRHQAYLDAQYFNPGAEEYGRKNPVFDAEDTRL